MSLPIRTGRRVALASAFAALALPSALLSAASPVTAQPQPKAKAATWNWPSIKSKVPLVIGHRGGSGYLPEHTLASYSLAITQGADYIEADLVSTKDGALISRHEPNLIGTTDVAKRPEFASRKRTVNVDGVPEEGFFASDFTLAEIKTLRAIQRLPDRGQAYDGRFTVPTFEEMIELAKRRSRSTGRTIGVYAETKHPTLHKQLGLPLEPKVVAVLKKEGLNTRSSPVFLQSFEPRSLKTLKKLSPVKRVQLIDGGGVADDGAITFAPPSDRPYDWTASGDPGLTSRTYGQMVTDPGLDEISSYADGIGPWKRYIVSTKADATLTTPGESARRTAPPSNLVQRAHRRGLIVHPFTFRSEQKYLAADYGTNPVEEYRQFFELGVDGVFSDFPDTAVTARTLLGIDKLAAS
ncbi:MAG: glycerophosphodiester phosphodiesterase [Solirubrobacteraceae bacterium]|nr:glycerophosphodiester phosphodiesterase [Solirubrobacteraceae bacterium]